jgi:hypothetical protein
MTSRRLLSHCALAGAAALAACGKAPRDGGGGTLDSASTTVATRDSVCGVVRVVGSDPAVLVQIEPTGGAPVTIGGSARDALRLLSAIDVCAHGPGATGAEWIAERFVVRAVSGEPAVDGTLLSRGGSFAVRTPDGREVPLASLPDALQREVGTRVWVVLDHRGNVKTFGMIR